MKGAIMTSGGGTKLFAAIGLTYPEGSTVTCSKGTKTLTANTTSGQWVFAIPEAGTWTVTATNGTDTASETVEITAEGQFESVWLAYEFLLFDNGSIVEWTPYNRNANGSCTIGDTIYCNRRAISGTYVSAHARTTNPVPIEKYKTLKVRFTNVTGQSAYIGVEDDYDSLGEDKDAPSKWSASKECTVSEFGSGGVATLDISSFASQSTTVIVGTIKTTGSTSSSFTVDRVWLE